MRHLRGFSLLELLVVMAIIALLMAIMMPVLVGARKLAQTAGCQSNLHQWSHIWLTFTEDNNGYFVQTVGWVKPLKPYYKDEQMHHCPSVGQGYYYGYGINGYIINPPTPPGFDPQRVYPYNWRTPHVKGAANVPMHLDCEYLVGWPDPNDLPPQWQDEPWINDLSNNMLRFCRNRHRAAINGAFLDFSVRKIGLKELWVLKWHRSYNINGRWTKAGGVQPEDWPDWMRRFKDY